MLLLSIFSMCVGSYAITPLIPIYCIESLANGGLAWSRAETFTLFGSFLALIYVSPFFGGVLGDFLLGKPLTALLGFFLFTSGLILLSELSSYDGVAAALLAIGLGIGFVKVTITAAIGRLPQVIRQKGYEYYYIASSLGFVSGGLLSNPLFNAFQMPGVVSIAVVSTAISLICFAAYFGRDVMRWPKNQHHPQESPSSPHPGGTAAFFFLLLLGVPYFLCSNQLATGMPIFLHQCVNRTIGSWTVPTLWFGATGSLAMTLLSPWLRAAWSGAFYRVEPLKYSIGCLIIAMAFATAAIAAMGSFSATSISAVPLFVCIHLSCFIADFHVRPVLFSAATSLVPARYHTLSTACVYACIGLGGKLAGTVASFVDAIGFAMMFAMCSLLAACCALISFSWWNQVRSSNQGLKPWWPSILHPKLPE